MRINRYKFLPCFLAFAFSLAAPTIAAPAPAFADAASMKTLGLTSQPVGHYDFCRRYPQKCLANKGAAAPLKLTQRHWQALLRINAAINKKVRAATDWEIYGREEYWEYPDRPGSRRRGDCEDYVLMKQRELQKYGIPAGDLLITVVRKPDGEAHAVLTVRTASGDYILDNLRDKVLNWQATEYRYIKRQSAHNAGLWVVIAPRQNAPLLAATALQAGTGRAQESRSLTSTRAIARRQ